MSPLFTQQERQELFDKVQAQQPPRPKTRAEKCASDRRVLVELVAEFPDVTAEELAKASGRSTSWARKVARESGIVLAKPVRQKKAGQP